MSYRNWKHRGTVLAAGLLVGVGSLIGYSVPAQQLGPEVVFAAPEAGAQESARPADGSYADVVAEVTPAVVTVRSERRTRAAQQHPFMQDPFFRDFFGERFREMPQPPQERREGGLGSGVIVHPDGYILTNHHVIDGAEQIKVEMTDHRVFDATVVGSDPPSDLAVLKIEGTDLPHLTLADTDQVRVGDVVLAVGNPLGVGQTVTMGIVSGKGRATGLGDGSFEDFIQTDAPINRGNSGGALVNTRGELVGINSQILSPSGGNIGIGFAIPSNMARNVMAQLIEHGQVRRGMLGVTVQPVTSGIARSLELSEVRGALVSDVAPESAAEKGGVERGDVILEFNGEAVRDSNDLRNKVAQTQPGTGVTLGVVRDGERASLDLVLDELPVRGEAERAAEAGTNGTGLGLSVQPLTPEMARRLEIDEAEGLVVRSVEPGGPASEAGIEAGDVILEVNGDGVGSVDELKAAFGETGDRPALVLVSREGRHLFLTVEARLS